MRVIVFRPLDQNIWEDFFIEQASTNWSWNASIPRYQNTKEELVLGSIFGGLFKSLSYLLSNLWGKQLENKLYMLGLMLLQMPCQEEDVGEALKEHSRARSC